MGALCSSCAKPSHHSSRHSSSHRNTVNTVNPVNTVNTVNPVNPVNPTPPPQPRESSATHERPDSPPRVSLNRRSTSDLFDPTTVASRVTYKPKRYTQEELVSATGGFTEDKAIGEGAFGKVFRGAFPDGSQVAIKVLSANATQGMEEFAAEVNTVGWLRHHFLVKLHGYCLEGKFAALVYEYLPGKSLHENLHSGKGSLSWGKRMIIAYQVAAGLEHLHSNNPQIIHRDLKSPNILLDNNFNAKVADFGLASKFKSYVSATASSDPPVWKGTLGNADPEYFWTRELSPRVDVYSFGILLLELVTGRKPVENGESILDWAKDQLENPDAVTIDFADASATDVSLSELQKLIKLARSWTLIGKDTIARSRPKMFEVVHELIFCGKYIPRPWNRASASGST